METQNKMIYTIEITPNQNEEPYTIELNTPDLKWSMAEYQRNRQPLTWKVIDFYQ